MAELKNMVVAFIFVLLVTTVAVQIYAQAASNGGYTNSPAFPLSAQVANYTNRTYALTQSLSAGTSNVSAAPVASNVFTGIGGQTTQAGVQAVSLTFDSLGMMLSMIATSQSALGFIIPPWVFGYGLIFVSLIMVFAILAAVFKWWL